MQHRLSSAGLLDIAGKLDRGERLALADGIRLFESPDLLAVGWLANREREKRHGAKTFYNYNIRLEATNVCVASCLFCAFARLKPGDPGAYTMSLEQAWDKLRQRRTQALTEIHLVNGLHPDLPWSYYTELLRGFKRIRPDVHLKCFTAVELAGFRTKPEGSRRSSRWPFIPTTTRCASCPRRARPTRCACTRCRGSCSTTSRT